MEPFGDASVELVEQPMGEQSILIDNVLEEGLASLSGASISLHAIVGNPNHKTCAFNELSPEKKEIVLIDTGSTYNFLDMFFI